MMVMTGYCKHGEFNLAEGCRMCVEERRAWEAGEQSSPVVIVSQGFPTAVVRVVDPGKDLKVVQLLGEIMRIKEWADKLVVTSEEHVKLATSDLGIMSSLKKAVEEKRREYVDPLNEYVKTINEAFKLLSVPLSEADKTARDRVLSYKQEQERRRLEAEAINRQKEELAGKEAEFSGTGEFTIDTTPVIVPDVVKTSRADTGATAGMVDNWKYEVTDFKALPDEYKVPDTAMLTAIARKHHDRKAVPGVRFYNEPTLRITK